MQAQQQQELRAWTRWMIRRDLDEVLAIEADSFGPDAWGEEDFLSHMRQRNCIAIVAEIGDRVVGYAVFLRQEDHIALLSLAVDKRYRRRGVGRQIANKIASMVRKRPERNRVHIDVPERMLDALLFLKACGFRAARVSRAMYGADEDGIEMVWKAT